MSTEGNDIALIRLPRLAITVNEDPDQIVLPICLGWPGVQVPQEKFEVAGWGRTNNDPFDSGDKRIAGAHSRLKLYRILAFSGPQKMQRKLVYTARAIQFSIYKIRAF